MVCNKFLFLIVFCLVSTAVFADVKVCVLNSKYAIAFDESEWDCKLIFNYRYTYPESTTNQHVYRAVNGVNRFDLIDFDLFDLPVSDAIRKKLMAEPKEGSFLAAKNFLEIYGSKNATIFSELEIEEFPTKYYSENYYKVKGKFFNNLGTGLFAVYVKPHIPLTQAPILCMFIKIYDPKDIEAVDNSYQEVFELIHPLVSN